MPDPKAWEQLLGLPLQLQVIFASGYSAYLLAYVGIRRNHRPADTIFGSLVFGLPALAIWSLAPSFVPLHPLLVAIVAFKASLAAAVIWRRFVRIPLRGMLRKIGYSWSDDTLSAWESLMENHSNTLGNLTVQLEDGRYLYSRDIARYEHCSFGPCVLGDNGDILLYVDASESADGDFREVDNVIDDNSGALITYVPRERIRKVSLRFTPGR